MDIKIIPKKLKGNILCPKSKSLLHRIMIAAALSSQDDLKALANFSNHSLDVTATFEGALKLNSASPLIDCNESGTTLRFLLPIVMATHSHGEFQLGPQLSKRPMHALFDAMEKKGCHFNTSNGSLIVDGKMSGGHFTLPGDVSSQFISGLLYALPLTPEGGSINLSTELESRPYVDMTIKCLSDFAIEVNEKKVNDLTSFYVPGNQLYSPKDITAFDVDGDWSSAAFWLTANYLGNHITLSNLNTSSSQGDMKILSHLTALKNNFEVQIDVKDTPDIVPILSVAAAFKKGGLTRISNIHRLRFKETDRINTTVQMIKSLGGKIYIEDNSLIIEGLNRLSGGVVNSHNDHRIAMAASIAATNTLNPVIIQNAEAVKKSYPDFFIDYAELGGEIVNL